MVNEMFWRGQLVDARRQRVPWHKIASAIRLLQTERVRDDRGLPWITLAGEVSGYTPVALREMLRTYDACVELSIRANLPMERLFHSIPMYAIEIISRIYNIDEKKAIDTIHKYEIKKISVGVLKQIYEDAKQNHPDRVSNAIIGRKVSDDFERLCFRAMANSDNPIVHEVFEGRSAEQDRCPVKVFEWMSKSKRFSPSFALIEYMNEKNSLISVVDCALLQGWSDDRIVQRLIYVDFVSKSFSRFWLLIPSLSPTDRAEKLIKQLEISSIGLVSVDQDNLRMRSFIKAPVNNDIKREPLIERDKLMRRGLDHGIDLSVYRNSDPDLDADDGITQFSP